MILIEITSDDQTKGSGLSLPRMGSVDRYKMARCLGKACITVPVFYMARAAR